MFRAIFIQTAALVMAVSANAMTVNQELWHGRSVIRVSGPIVAGDATKFANAMATAPVWPHGTPVVLLDSPGGDVEEALKISRFLNLRSAHMVIPRGARCASACASILFIAGTYRTLEDGGSFGQHSCAVGGIADVKCNDLISTHAIEHGVSHGSVRAFLNHFAPEKMGWFDRSQADCYGLTRYPYERESGFEQAEPCVMQAISGKMPGAQTAWRIDFKGTGYRAFQRTVHDHEREMEMSLYCDERKLGSVFIGMDIRGRYDRVREAVIGGSFQSQVINRPSASYQITDAGGGYSHFAVEILRADVPKFLTSANKIQLRAKLKKPYKDMIATSYIANSRKALLFAANNCVNARTPR
jgi:hypothetical protein